jgi:hypothetical protein
MFLIQKQIIRDSSLELSNLGIAASVSSNALTIALKQKDGSDPNAGGAVTVGFRHATAATGQFNRRQVTSALSLTISSGSTLGHTSGATNYIYVYLLDNSGTIELAASSVPCDEGSVQSTTAEGGSGGADSLSGFYSTTARTDVPVRLIARLKSNQTTAGTWAAVPTEISLVPFDIPKIHARYTTAAGQSVNDSTDTVIGFNTKVIDNYNTFVAASGRFNAPRAGNYLVTASVLWSANSTGVRELRVYKNSSYVINLSYNGGPTGNAAANVGSTLIALGVDDFIEIAGRQSSGGALTLVNDAVYNYINIIEV